MKKLILISLIVSGFIFLPGEAKAQKKDTACLVIITKPGDIKPKPKGKNGKRSEKKIVRKRKVKKT